MSADIIDFEEHHLRRLALAVEVQERVDRLPEHARRAFLWLLRLYVERNAAPSAQLDATIERVERAFFEGRVHELDPPESLLSH